MEVNQPIWPESYVPAPDLPRWFVSGLNILGGYNLFAQPNYRVCWGMDERDFLNDNPRAIKYINPRDSDLGWACWMLERFAAPGFYNKVQWEIVRFGPDENGTGKTIDYLGPYPSRGSYLLVAPLIEDDGTGDAGSMYPLELSSGLLEEIKRRVTFGMQKDQTLGVMALQQKKKAAADAAKVAKLTGELKEYYLTHEKEINTQHTRRYSNLTGARVLPAPNLNLMKDFKGLTLGQGVSNVSERTANP